MNSISQSNDTHTINQSEYTNMNQSNGTNTQPSHFESPNSHWYKICRDTMSKFRILRLKKTYNNKKCLRILKILFSSSLAFYEDIFSTKNKKYFTLQYQTNKNLTFQLSYLSKILIPRKPKSLILNGI